MRNVRRVSRKQASAACRGNIGYRDRRNIVVCLRTAVNKLTDSSVKRALDTSFVEYYFLQCTGVTIVLQE
jgi:hypothetical protein